MCRPRCTGCMPWPVLPAQSATPLGIGATRPPGSPAEPTRETPRHRPAVLCLIQGPTRTLATQPPNPKRGFPKVLMCVYVWGEFGKFGVGSGWLGGALPRLAGVALLPSVWHWGGGGQKLKGSSYGTVWVPFLQRNSRLWPPVAGEEPPPMPLRLRVPSGHGRERPAGVASHQRHNTFQQPRQYRPLTWALTRAPRPDLLVPCGMTPPAPPPASPRCCRPHCYSYALNHSASVFHLSSACDFSRGL